VTFAYAAVTPVRDDAANLERLSACMVAQVRRPVAWIIVDNGSVDGTPELAERLACEHPWITPLAIPGAPTVVRGAPIVVWGPGTPAVMHAVDEYVELAELEQAVAVFTDVITRWGG